MESEQQGHVKKKDKQMAITYLFEKKAWKTNILKRWMNVLSCIL